MKKAVLFQDEGKDIRITYPELMQIDEFKNLSDKEMRFVYYFACDTSPFKNLKPEEKIIRSLEVIKDTLSGEQVAAFAKQQFSDKIKFAIDRMQRFDTSVRMNAREVTEKFFAQIQKIADTDVAKEEDIEKKKKYIDLVASSIKILPNIVSQLENGFGIRYVEEVQEEVVIDSKVKWEHSVEGKK